MIEAFETLRNEFRTFGTDVISIALVCAGILYCMARKEHLNKSVQKVTGYELLFFVLVANPFGYEIIKSFWLEDYGKIFMILLPVIMVAVVVTEIIAEQNKIWKGIAAMFCCVGIIASSSFFDWNHIQFEKIENEYKVEHEILALDEIIRAQGVNPQNMIAPRAVCAQIREVNPGVGLMYGESLIESIIDKTATSEIEEEQQFIDYCTTIIAVPEAVDYQLAAAEQYKSNCIVLERDYDNMELMTAADFWCGGRTEDYVIYFKD